MTRIRYPAVLMATVALSVQPLQLWVLAGLGRAMAQTTCIPSPINRCASFPDEPLPGGTLPPSSAIAVKYVLLPGIGDGVAGNDGQSQYFNHTNLATYLQQSSNSANVSQYSVSVTRPWTDWRVKGLAQQGNELAATLNAASTNNAKLILIAHSMGGLRGRQALQFNQGNYPNLGTNVKALITMGTPHAGAPVLNNAIPAATMLAGVFGTALSGFVGFSNFTPLIGGAVGMYGARASLVPLVNSVSGYDMRPGSSFLNALNDPAAPKLPVGLVTVSVKGNNSNIDSYAASAGFFGSTAETTAARHIFAGYFAVAGALMIAGGLFSFGLTIPWGLALLAASYLLSIMPAFWRSNVMGSEEGDSIVPAESQVKPANAGGDSSEGDLILPFATHTGRYGEYQAQSSGEYQDNLMFQSKIRLVQLRVGVPRSPE